MNFAVITITARGGPHSGYQTTNHREDFSWPLPRTLTWPWTRPRRILLAAASMFALLATLLPATADAEQYVQNGIGWGNCVFSSWISDEGSLGGAESGTGTWDTDCNGVASKLHYFNFNDYFTTQWDIDWRNGNEFIVATWGNINNPLSGSTVPYYNQACAHTVANGWGCYNHFFGSPT